MSTLHGWDVEYDTGTVYVHLSKGDESITVAAPLRKPSLIAVSGRIMFELDTDAVRAAVDAHQRRKR